MREPAIQSLRVGYVPLLDAALLHVARERGFAAGRGLELVLVPETSWANIRDKLAAGFLDAAHMLAPAAIASTLGLGHAAAPLVAPVALGLDGNAITLSLALFEAVKTETAGSMADPAATARGLARVIAKRRAGGVPPLTLAHVFPFSSHHYQLRLWLAAGGVDPDADVHLIVTPPPFMARSLAEGQIDGFCVGAPWNSVAAQAGAGRILHACREIVRNCPEKVLAFRAGFASANGSCVAALSAAIREAADWSAEPANLDHLVGLLARVAITQEEWFRISPALLREILAPRSGSSPLATLRLDQDATRVNPEHARWLFGRMVDAHQVINLPENEAIALSVYRPDLGDEPPSKPTIFSDPIVFPGF